VVMFPISRDPPEGGTLGNTKSTSLGLIVKVSNF